jgi:hypothetical protein
MSDNVIILGAGASYDAGIPLLGNFIDKMIEISATGRGPRGVLKSEEQSILKKALEIRNKIENYHARVAIDQFNLEQILSVLVFESQIGNSKGKRDLEIFSKAIATMIELTCNVMHDGKFNTIQESKKQVYCNFWKNLIWHHSAGMENIPTILSFNYDLVLERSLAQAIVGHKDFDFWRKTRFDGFQLDFQSEACESPVFLLKQARWEGMPSEQKMGFILEQDKNVGEAESKNIAKIKILKLHGSLNFPHRKNEEEWSMVKAVENAKIIPPVFNKADSTFASPIWKSALNELRNCKNLIVCGYSLPTTDTYMQYFLKAALGPNLHLNKICVFDPELYKSDTKGEELKKRYMECFSPQFKQRIDFQPSGKVSAGTKLGTFAHMVSLFTHEPAQLLFGLNPEEK